jgi:hypothetical protein
LAGVFDAAVAAPESDDDVLAGLRLLPPPTGFWRLSAALVLAFLGAGLRGAGEYLNQTLRGAGEYLNQTSLLASWSSGASPAAAADGSSSPPW